MFDDLGLHESLVRSLAACGFTAPTPVQQAAVPPAVAGRDVLASAPTGTGKTAAFLLPLLQRLQQGKPRRNARALVLTPTRELAGQVEEQLRRLAGRSGLRGAIIVGGVAMGPQVRALRTGVDVLVATPGRLLDHLQQGNARLGDVEILVLDEADRMLDMGFLPAIRQVLALIPEERQTLLFSATLPRPIVELSRSLLRDPVRVDLQPKTSAAAGIRQAAYPIAHDDKAGLLLHLLADDVVGNALVFTRTKHRANRLARTLEQRGVPCAAIHGNRTQAQRTQALSGFRSGRFRVLVATDVASRGIDVEKLSHVVNFDVPQSAEDYVHRIGRTARAQATGDAWTFISPAEEREWRDIERVLGRRLERVAVDGFVGASPLAEEELVEEPQQRDPRSAAAASRGTRGTQHGAQPRPRTSHHGAPFARPHTAQSAAGAWQAPRQRGAHDAGQPRPRTTHEAQSSRSRPMHDAPRSRSHEAQDLPRSSHVTQDVPSRRAHATHDLPSRRSHATHDVPRSRSNGGWGPPRAWSNAEQDTPRS
ncbi:DEAD/DEAH box helicase, partial [Candidatus Binatia bacterium]|nr:DEAD/DEAH box helicase [Candidatus Binatia bacterium]